MRLIEIVFVNLQSKNMHLHNGNHEEIQYCGLMPPK